MLIYLDSCIVIYLIERTAGFGARAAAHVAARLGPGDHLVASDLTRLECRSTPFAAGDTMLLADFDHFFGTTVTLVTQLTTAVCDRATEIRGRYRFKTPDALHLAAAIEAGCGLFLTNDTRLARFTGLTVEVLP